MVVSLKDYRIDLPKMRRAITALTKMVFVANPNNPTGTIVTAEEVDKFLDKVPDHVIVVFDEAYYDFAAGPDFPDALGHLRHGKRVVILRTFSKMASLAGLRVGYAVADPDCIALVNRIRQPFNVNTLAQVAALAALADESHVRRSVEAVREGVRSLAAALDQPGRPPRPEPGQLHPGRVRRCGASLRGAPQARRDRAPDGELRPRAGAPASRSGRPRRTRGWSNGLRTVLGKGATRS